MIALITFAAMNVVTWIRSAREIDLRDASALDLAILGAALTGGAIGFLWYNAFPAEVIMGDTGSMALGGAIGAFAVMTKTELLLLLIGGIFVVEAVSVILQVFSFRYWGRRLFLMAPIHHHFEMKAWSETKIMVRFWILAAIMCAAAFAFYYRYYLDFRALRDELARPRARAFGPGGGTRATATRGGGDRSRCVAGPRRRQACRVGRRNSSRDRGGAFARRRRDSGQEPWGAG